MQKLILSQLPYSYNELEGVISQKIVELHHDKHQAAYVNGANAALEKLEKSRNGELEINVREVLRDWSFNYNGVVLHELFWLGMRKPNAENKPNEEVLKKIEESFGSWESFKKELTAAAVTTEGSGWAVLWQDKDKNLMIGQVEKHNLLGLNGWKPILALDVWEHAYYLDYLNNRAALSQEVANFSQKPILDIILVGDDPASIKYVELKQSKAESIGIGGQIHRLDQNSSTADVLSLIEKLNQDQNVTGLMIQLPLPSQIDTNKVLLSIRPSKDADGLNPINLALLFQKDNRGIAAATSLGVLKLLEEYQIDLSGKNAVIIGRSPDVSLPLFALLMAKNCTVTICHSYTQDMAKICQQADILISAIGKPKFLGKEYIKKDAVVIDVGYATDPATGKTSGDFDFEAVKDLVSYITPVPGGVGPMTVASLLSNTVDIAKKML